MATEAVGIAGTPVASNPAMLSDTGSSVDPLMSQCYDALLSNPDHIAGTLRMMAGWDLRLCSSAYRSWRCLFG
ncbi:MAG: hypothetical protein CM15mP103_02880 [Gammaproteobacteria bacterium]|nr:MAG: hypothetical protein CM15mP103_02880 [Gammaproteobacteria bacterium]